MRMLITAIVAALLLAPVQAARTFGGATTDVVAMGADSAVDSHSAVTACVWARPTTVPPSTTGRLMHHGDLSTTPFIEWDLLENPSGKFSFETQFASPIGATTATVNVWQDVCGVWTGTGATVYLNGVSDATVAGSGTFVHTSNTTEIGNSTVFGNQAFAGQLAEAAIWTVADAAIPVRFHTGVSPMQIRPANLKGYWPLTGHQSPEPDLFSAFRGTVTGTVAATTHPRVFGR